MKRAPPLALRGPFLLEIGVNPQEGNRVAAPIPAALLPPRRPLHSCSRPGGYALLFPFQKQLPLLPSTALDGPRPRGRIGVSLV